MVNQYTGMVQFANGQPATGVHVRLFDRDIGDIDDDLTVEEGVSGADGRFTVTYKRARLLDFADIFLPYLTFTYRRNGRKEVHHAFIQPFKETYQLPVIPPVEFIPAGHGYQFVNSFPGYWIPFSIPSFPDIPAVDKYYGLCGGMCASALDFRLAGRPIPRRRRRPGRATPLHQYIHQRQVDSLDVLGKQVVRFARWMALSDEAVQQRTRNEFEQLKQALDKGNPTPIGLVYVSSRDTMQIWQNHQVLACGYEVFPDRISILIYDPNFPRRNDVSIVCRPDDGFRSSQRMGRSRKHVRGWFVMPYTPIVPPEHLTLDS